MSTYIIPMLVLQAIIFTTVLICGAFRMNDFQESKAICWTGIILGSIGLIGTVWLSFDILTRLPEWV